MTCLQAHSVPMSHPAFDVPFLTTFMASPIQECEQPSVSSFQDSYGHGSIADVRQWTRACINCQRSKVQTHAVSPTGTFLPPDTHFEHVHVDLVGPLPPSQGYTHLLTCVDRFTRWPKAIPLTNITTEAVAQAFLSGWIARFGVPTTLTSDRIGQFESGL